ncbi:MAG TPA: hypothetical protein VGW77_05525 [Candidatus Binatia bacterium]|nr:hypothetical protein [Candidatus Binatia bacterium]
MIAPRGLHPKLQREGKLSRQRPSAEARTAPSGIQSPKSPAIDNLGIAKGFEGIGFANSFGSVPPDTHVATGPEHIVEVTNTTIAYYSRATGKRLFIQDLFVFFAPAGVVQFGFDPVVTYDEIAQRFVVAMIDEDDTLIKSFLLYAVSNSTNPLDGFSEMHRIDVTEHGNVVDETVLADFPKIGWNADVHVITVNMFGAVSFPPPFDHVSVMVVDKSTALDGNNSTFSVSHLDRDPDDFTLMPAVMHGAESGDPMWFVIESADAFGSEIRVVKMTDVLGSPSFSETSLAVDAYDFPPNAEQPGSTTCGPNSCGRIQTNDSSIISAAWRNDRLFAAHAIGLDSTSQAHVRWYEFNTSGSSPTLTQQGTINPGVGIHTYYPSVEIAPNGDVGMTFMQSSSTEFMSMYVTGQNSANAPGEVRTPVLAKAGLRTYRAFDCVIGSFFVDDCRAGDYSGISIDPNFSNMFCAANEYASSKSSNNWGTWITCFAIGIHDLAVTAITAPSTVKGTAAVNAAVTVTIQNRSDHSEAFTLVNLGNGLSTGLVRLSASVIDNDSEQCQSPVVALDAAKNAALFGSGGSKVLAPKQTAKIAYLVTLQCTSALSTNSSDTTRGDYSFSASVHHDVLDGSADIHDEDDVCPRDALPGGVDSLPPPKGIKDKGCGAKKTDGSLGAPVVTDVVL